MAEEQRCEASSAPPLCADNCGFYGNPATLNLCSKCYRRHESEKLLTKGAKTASSSSTFSATEDRVEDVVVSSTKAVTEKTNGETTSCGPSRCGACRKRVGLTGFKCKCGAMYCGVHRYPEKHSCSFDFKVVGKEAIAKANPVVKADKLENKLR